MIVESQQHTAYFGMKAHEQEDLFLAALLRHLKRDIVAWLLSLGWEAVELGLTRLWRHPELTQGHLVSIVGAIGIQDACAHNPGFRDQLLTKYASEHAGLAGEGKAL